MFTTGPLSLTALSQRGTRPARTKPRGIPAPHIRLCGTRTPLAVNAWAHPGGSRQELPLKVAFTGTPMPRVYGMHALAARTTPHVLFTTHCSLQHAAAP